MVELEDLLKMINPEVHARLRRAIETGRWEDGARLRPDQIEHCMQAVIAWEQKHLPPEERVGYMGDVCKSRSDAPVDADLIQRMSLNDPSATRH